MVTMTATVVQVFCANPRRDDHVFWDSHKREWCSTGDKNLWGVRLKEPSLMNVFPLSDLSCTMFRPKDEHPALVEGKRYTMDINAGEKFRTLVSWRELFEENEPDVIDEALASVGMVGGGRKVTSCPPPPPPVQPDQAQLELMRRRLDERKAQRRQEGR
jgi:hypothetical protein